MKIEERQQPEYKPQQLLWALRIPSERSQQLGIYGEKVHKRNKMLKGLAFLITIGLLFALAGGCAKKYSMQYERWEEEPQPEFLNKDLDTTNIPKLSVMEDKNG